MRKRPFLEYLNDTSQLKKLPLVELAGENRVLIENHLGISAYSNEKIQVKVSFGELSIQGCGLQLMEICREQLVIRGEIWSVQLIRR